MNRDIYTDELHNSIRLSEFNKLHTETKFSNVAAKFVIQGKESYIINNNRFQVNKGEYIIGNNDQLSEVTISENTVGLCIDISNEIIREIAETLFDNPDLKEFILTDKFLINKYKAQNTTLGHRLSVLSSMLLRRDKDSLLTSELFYSIGESIVNDQALVFEQLSKLNYKKQSVNEEVFRSLLNAKNHIEAHFLDNLNLDKLIDVALVSKYAFIRQFKTTFGITPYQYVLQKKLLYAKSCLLQDRPVQEVALITGFADTPTFSKAFKQYFGMSPSKIRK